MSGINKAIIIGRLGQDPELKQTNNGTAVCNFSIATSENWKDQNGEAQEKTEWHRVVVWAKLAENCAKYLKKGSQAFIEGNLQTRKWQAEDGTDRYSTEIVARNVQFLSSNTTQAASAGNDSIIDDIKPDVKNHAPGATNAPEAFNAAEEVPF